MRNLILICIIPFAICGCAKSKIAKKTTTTDFVHGFIPNWRQDTLIDQLPATTWANFHYDTIFSYVSGDTSIINYNGNKLYVFYYGSSAINHSDSSIIYIDCFISPIAFDTLSKWSRCTVASSKYYNQSYNEWMNQKVAIMLSDIYPHFDTSMSNFYEASNP